MRQQASERWRHTAVAAALTMRQSLPICTQEPTVVASTTVRGPITTCSPIFIGTCIDADVLSRAAPAAPTAPAAPAAPVVPSAFGGGRMTAPAPSTQNFPMLMRARSPRSSVSRRTMVFGGGGDGQGKRRWRRRDIRSKWRERCATQWGACDLPSRASGSGAALGAWTRG